MNWRYGRIAWVAAIVTLSPIAAARADEPATAQALAGDTAREASTGVEQDTLHRDPRWPRLRYCIQNTQTAEAFQTCLERALLQKANGNVGKTDRERMLRKPVTRLVRRNASERGG